MWPQMQTGIDELTWFSLNCDTVCGLVQRLDYNVDKVKLTLQHTTSHAMLKQASG